MKNKPPKIGPNQIEKTKSMFGKLKSEGRI